MISMLKWRSKIALVACIVTFVCAFLAIGASMVRYVHQEWAVSNLFRFFTTLSNMLTALATTFITPFAVEGIRKKRFVTPKWLSMLHYSGTVCISIVFVFAMCFILPYDRDFAIGGSNFYLHVICPVMVLISFMLVESRHEYSKKDLLKCLMPFIIYSFIYLFMVVIKGPENGGWNDLYKLNTFIPAYISFPLMWAFAFGVAMAIYKISGMINRKRRERMIASWSEDTDPVSINIEVYGLGRYYGLQGDRDDLSIPYDIIEMLAERYSMDTERLVKVYLKGLTEGVKEKEAYFEGLKERKAKQ